MMDFEELWQTVFEAPISPVEEQIMLGVYRRVDLDEVAITLAAITVRMLYVVLIEDEASPLRIMRNFGQAMEENRRMTGLISKTYERLQPRLAEVEGTIVRLENVLAEARELGEAKTGYHPIFGHVPATETDTSAGLPVQTIALLCAACFASAFLGLTICMLIFLG